MSCLGDPPLDIVLFLLDDMRSDEVAYLSETTDSLASMSVTFSRSYATTPLCAPSRASLLSGGWAPQSVGVTRNVLPDGGAEAFDDHRTLATRLQAAGYATALFGKYLNQYEDLGPYVPPGWTTWGATLTGTEWSNFTVMAGASTPDAPGVAEETTWPGYATTWQSAASIAFLDAHPDGPVFLYVPFLAPHEPHTPATVDVGALAGTPWQAGAFNEADVSDKPAWIQALPLLEGDALADLEEAVEERNESLLAVDRAMVEIIDAVRASPRAGTTVFILASDNGLLWGEHRLDGKGVGYEEAVHVPVIVAFPGLTPRDEPALVAMNLDLGATLQALAGLPVEGDGQSLVDALCGAGALTRTDVPVQGWPNEHPAWAGVVTAEDAYLETVTGERELYALPADPFQERNAALDPAMADVVAARAARVAESRGLVVTTSTLPTGRAGESYQAQMDAWGGQLPLTWSAVDLPAGLTLGADGSVTGSPAQEGSYTFEVTVADASASQYDGRPEVRSQSVTLEVGPAGESRAPPVGGCGCGGETAAGGWLVGGLLALRRRR